MIETSLLIDVEARRLLFVERAESDVAAPAPLELHRLGEELDDPRLASDTIDGLLSDHRSRHTLKSSEEHRGASAP
jgi:hypothetical protein